MATVTTTAGQSTNQNTELWLNISVIWHAVVSLGGLGGIFWAWQSEALADRAWLQILLTVLLLLTVGLSGTTIPLIMKR
ncbi:MAG: hypothetical protein R3264_07925, partial [Anaerolineae bacterium]|nr:hypothetical protein [Anaerolineae bacterium]